MCMKTIKKVVNRIKRQINPIKFWRKQGAKIGEACEIYPTVTIDSEPYLVKIGNNVRINSGVHLITHDGACWVVRNLNENFNDVDLFGMIFIDDNVSIGTNALILKNVTIGKNSIIGAGAVVTKDVPPNSVYAGVPAKFICTLHEYIEKHEKEFLHTKYFSTKEKKVYIANKVKK